MAQHETPANPGTAIPRWRDVRRRRGQSWARWLKGSGFLVFHLDLFLVVIAPLLLLNIARSPTHLWVAGVFWRWGLLLVIHGMVTLLLWLVSMLLSEERPGAGTYEAEWTATPAPVSRPSPVIDLGRTTPWGEPPVDVPFAPHRPDGAANGWTASTSPTSRDGDDQQRTSWAETSAPAWLARRRGEPDPATETPEASEGDQ